MDVAVPEGSGRRDPPVRAPLAGGVLCGGASRRMGADKALLDLGRGPLAFDLAGRLMEVADPVLLAPGTPGRLGPVRWLEVEDEVPGAGPLGGLAALLAAAPAALVAVVAVDLPLAEPRLLGWLRDRWRGEPALVPLDEAGRPQPLHALYATGALGAARDALADGVRAVREWLGHVDGVRYVAASEWRGAHAPDDRWSRNLNSPEDVEALTALLDAAEPEPKLPGTPGTLEA